MAKNAKGTPQTSGKLATARSYLAHHKLGTAVIVFLIIIVAIVCGRKYYVYSHHFSEKDFNAVAAMAETVLKNSGGKDIQQSRTCGYEHIGELFPKIQLYCSVAMVTYMPYESNEHAIVIARSYEASIRKDFGTTYGNISGFTDRPDSGYSDITVALPPPHKGYQCNFQIGSNRFAENIARSLPNRAGDGLIALYFECAADSRREYYPVTYR